MSSLAVSPGEASLSAVQPQSRREPVRGKSNGKLFLSHLLCHSLSMQSTSCVLIHHPLLVRNWWDRGTESRVYTFNEELMRKVAMQLPITPANNKINSTTKEFFFKYLFNLCPTDEVAAGESSSLMAAVVDVRVLFKLAGWDCCEDCCDLTKRTCFKARWGVEVWSDKSPVIFISCFTAAFYSWRVHSVLPW